MGYFISVGDCTTCGWPHHMRYHFAARRARRRKPGRVAGHYDQCCNCHKRSYHYELP